MNTDLAWEAWATRDPYFAVLTDPRFRRGTMSATDREAFFSLGRAHADHVIATCCQRVSPGFRPARILDFGCGVGRLLIPFAQQASEVVGVDISPSMLDEARRNCSAAGVGNVRLCLSDDSLSQVEGQFDLVHSAIVIQHIEIPRGLALFKALLSRIRPGGVGAIQVTFAWDYYAANDGVRPQDPAPPALPWWRLLQQDLAQRLFGAPRSQERPPPPDADPEMQMNFYNLGQLMFCIERTGVRDVHVELSNHGGAVGAFMFFRLPDA